MLQAQRNKMRDSNKAFIEFGLPRVVIAIVRMNPPKRGVKLFTVNVPQVSHFVQNVEGLILPFRFGRQTTKNSGSAVTMDSNYFKTTINVT